jgi:Bacteriophage CI repressor helix-turn-helix domain
MSGPAQGLTATEHDLIEARRRFVLRLQEIADKVGGKSELARKAGIAPSSLANYFGRSEPPLSALVLLARAGRVSVDWLSGADVPPRPAEFIPPGYIRVPFFSLRETGCHIRAIGADFDQATETRLFRQGDLIGKAAISTRSFATGESGDLAFEPIIGAGELLLIDVMHGHHVTRPTPVDSWPIEESGIYLIGDVAWLKLRRLHRKDARVQVIRPDGKVERTLTGAPGDFILYGRVVWRGGVIAPLS